MAKSSSSLVPRRPASTGFLGMHSFTPSRDDRNASIAREEVVLVRTQDRLPTLPLLIYPCLWYYGYLGPIPAQKDPLGANEHYDSTVEKKQAGATLNLWTSIAGSR